MKDYTIKVTAGQLYRRKLLRKIIVLTFLFFLLVISVVYLFLYIMNGDGNFTVSVDREMSNKKDIYLSIDGSKKNKTRKLSANTIDYMDNISINWLPKDLDTSADGSHNGDNYIALSFYVVNGGENVINYWYELVIDDIIKDVDEAVRVMIYKNGKPTVYAKANKSTNGAEVGTILFESEKKVVIDSSKNFKPGMKDHYTIVVWVEGDDPDCNNDLLGGMMAMHLDIRGEHISKNRRGRK